MCAEYHSPNRERGFGAAMFNSEGHLRSNNRRLVADCPCQKEHSASSATIGVVKQAVIDGPALPGE